MAVSLGYFSNTELKKKYFVISNTNNRLINYILLLRLNIVSDIKCYDIVAISYYQSLVFFIYL